LVDTRILLKYW